jgi:hypothetical protein
MPAVHRFAGTLIALILFFWGMWSFPLAMLGPERNLVPGDMGDARFNNYVLEHFHAYATGRVDSYWDAPMMYPQKNVIARSDNLLGTAPVYSAFRAMGWSRESAFQLWILVLFALNFWCAFLALKTWTGSTIGAACGAFIFAFGIHQIGHLNHVQVYPRFMIPLALLGWWRVLEGGHGRWWHVAVLATVYQFWCGIYLGFILAYGLLVLTVAHFAVVRGGAMAHCIKRASWRWHGAGAVLAGAALLAPLMLPYMAMSDETGMRPFSEVANSVPRPISFFFSDPAALNWRDLAWHSQFAFPEWWHHMHFMGAVAWAGVLTVAGILVMRKTNWPLRQRMLVVLIAWALSILLCLNVAGVHTYRVVYALPGFSALRSIDRFIMVQSFFFVLLLSYAVAAVRRPRWVLWPIGAVLSVATVLDHRIEMDWTRRFDKFQSQREVDRIAWQMQQQRSTPDGPMAWCPVRPPMPDEDEHQLTIAANISAMLAAQQVGAPVVNAYTGSYPDGFMAFFDHMDRPTLQHWLGRNGVEPAAVEVVDNVGLPWVGHEKVVLTDAAGRQVRMRDPFSGTIALADGPGDLGSCFTIIELEEGRRVLLATNDRFVAATLDHGDLSLRADAPVAGDFCLFVLDEVEEGGVRLRADNDRWVAAADDGRLHAWADSAHHAITFRLEPLPQGVR